MSENSPENEAIDEAPSIRPARTVPRSVPWGELAGVLAVVLGAVVLALLVFHRPAGKHGPAASIAPGIADRLMSLKPRVNLPATLDLAGTVSGETLVLPEGAAVDLSFRVEAPARAVVLEERARYSLVQLYPPVGYGADVLEAGREVQVTASDGGPLVITDPPGTRRVRLVVFPPEVDPVTLQPTELLRMGASLTVVERVYEAGWREGAR